jgi:hypothetical protein
MRGLMLLLIILGVVWALSGVLSRLAGRPGIAKGESGIGS